MRATFPVEGALQAHLTHKCAWSRPVRPGEAEVGAEPALHRDRPRHQVRARHKTGVVQAERVCSLSRSESVARFRTPANLGFLTSVAYSRPLQSIPYRVLLERRRGLLRRCDRRVQDRANTTHPGTMASQRFSRPPYDRAEPSDWRNGTTRAREIRVG